VYYVIAISSVGKAVEISRHRKEEKAMVRALNVLENIPPVLAVFVHWAEGRKDAEGMGAMRYWAHKQQFGDPIDRMVYYDSDGRVDPETGLTHMQKLVMDLAEAGDPRVGWIALP